MTIHFTITPAWVEFLCHFFAAFLYFVAGDISINRNKDHLASLAFLFAIVLNIIGAHQ